MGFVASGANKRTYAHELGHGAFGLEHTFPEIGQSLSNNLMDYGDSTHLTHKQCKDIAKRKFVFNWLDSEEDGSYRNELISKHFKNDVFLIKVLKGTTSFLQKDDNNISVTLLKQALAVLNYYEGNNPKTNFTIPFVQTPSTASEFTAATKVVVENFQSDNLALNPNAPLISNTPTSGGAALVVDGIVGSKTIETLDWLIYLWERENPTLTVATASTRTQLLSNSFNATQVISDFATKTTTQKQEQQDALASILDKLGKLPDGCIVTEKDGIYSYKVKKNGNTNIQVINFSPLEKALLGALTSRNSKFSVLGALIKELVGLSTTLNTANPCEFCPASRNILRTPPSARTAIVENIEEIYTRAGNTPVACRGLQKLCKDISSFGTYSGMPPLTTSSPMEIVSALLTFADTPNGATRAQKLNAFFTQITATGQDARHISNHITNNWGNNMREDQIIAWEKLYPSGFETDFEYIRTLSYKGYKDDLILTNGTTGLFVDMTDPAYTITKGTTSGTTTMIIACNNIFSNSIRKIGNVSHITTTAAQTTGKQTSATYSRTQTNTLLNVVPLIPNAIYVVDFITYRTDTEGRVSQITAILDTNKRGRDEFQQQQAKHFKDGASNAVDDGGHMIGSRFRGIVEQINYFPQEIASNRYADWKNMEDEWEAVAKGKRLTRNGAVIVSAGTPRTVSVDIKPQFNGNSKRPFEFRVDFSYNGVAQTRRDISNP